MKLTTLSLALIAALALVPSVSSSAPKLVDPPLPGVSTKPAQPEEDQSIFELLMGEEKDPDPEVVCQSKDGEDRCVPKYRFSEDVNAHSAKKLVKWIEVANKAGANELLIEINTPGGAVDAGFDIIKAIEDSEAPVSCVVDGDADSMGFGILQACNWRYMTARSKLMAHEPSLSGFMGGRPNEWQSVADMLKMTAYQIAWQCQHRLKVSMDEYHKHVDGGKMWWMLGPDALKVGAIDEQVNTVKGLHKLLLQKNSH